MEDDDDDVENEVPGQSPVQKASTSTSHERTPLILRSSKNAVDQSTDEILNSSAPHKWYNR